ncbi:MAG TPA: ribosome recycling factor, partial [Phycisphaerales bacterium]|nr:ribosome recycling factor [Phycisphaerales bacterium]
MSIKEQTNSCKSKMDRTIEYFTKELHGVRTGRASTALIDFIKVDYYGSQTDLKDI